MYSSEYTYRSGGYRDDVTPVPIPNTEVKLVFGDDTWIIKSWESSTPPVLSKKTSKDVFFVLRVCYGFWPFFVSYPPLVILNLFQDLHNNAVIPALLKESLSNLFATFS